MTKAEREAMPCYVGRRPCGCVGFAAIDEPAHARDNAKEVAKVIRAGWTIERQSVKWVRENWGPGCVVCNRKKVKAANVNQEALPL